MPLTANLPPFLVWPGLARLKGNMDAPTKLSRQAIDEFKAIYEAEFGEALADDAAEEMALRLLRVFDLLSRPVPAGAEGVLPVIHC